MLASNMNGICWNSLLHGWVKVNYDSNATENDLNRAYNRVVFNFDNEFVVDFVESLYTSLLPQLNYGR